MAQRRATLPGMGEHAEAADEAGTESPAKHAAVDWRHSKDRVVGFLATLVRWVGLIFAAVLALHVLFVIGDGNSANGIVSFVNGWAESISLGFKDLFTPQDPKLNVLVNYGIAAIFWLVASAVLARLIRRVGGSTP